MDISAIKKRLSQLQTSNNRTSNLWKPQPGKTQIRIVPNTTNKEMPFIELFFHYDLNSRSYLSPISFGRPDPIEEFSNKLKTSGNREDYQLGRKIEAKLRAFAPVIVRGDEKEGVKFWGFGKTVYQELLSVIADPDYGDISDPVNGRDVVVEFKTAEETGRAFPSTSIRVKPNQTPMAESKDKLDKMMESQKDIRDIYNELSYDELTEALNDWLNPKEDGDEEEESKDGNSVSKDLSNAAATSVDASQAFDELFAK